MRSLMTTALLSLAIGAIPAFAGSSNLNNVQYWVGTGSNQAGFVVDFQQGPGSALLWGYRYNGSATAWDMFSAITGSTAIVNAGYATPTPPAGADSRLSASLSSYTPFPGFAPPANLFVDTISYTGTGGAPAFARTGDFLVSWAFLESSDGTTWAEGSPSAMATSLTYNHFYAWSYSGQYLLPDYNFAYTAPGALTPVSVPEPTALSLLVLGGMGVLLRRRTRTQV